jgi:hypothetical protein
MNEHRDLAVGTLTFELEVMWAEKDEPIDLDFVGGIVMEPVLRALRSRPPGTWAYGRLRYMGAKPSGLEPLWERDVEPPAKSDKES